MARKDQHYFRLPPKTIRILASMRPHAPQELHPFATMVEDTLRSASSHNCQSSRLHGVEPSFSSRHDEGCQCGRIGNSLRATDASWPLLSSMSVTMTSGLSNARAAKEVGHTHIIEDYTQHTEARASDLTRIIPIQNSVSSWPSACGCMTPDPASRTTPAPRTRLLTRMTTRSPCPSPPSLLVVAFSCPASILEAVVPLYSLRYCKLPFGTTAEK